MSDKIKNQVTLCSGCYDKGKEVHSFSKYMKSSRHFQNFDFGFMCCSLKCAQDIWSRKPYKTLLNFAASDVRFVRKWNRVQKICDKINSKNEDKISCDFVKQMIKNEVLQESRISPTEFESSNFFMLVIFGMLSQEFKAAYHVLKFYICTATQLEINKIKRKSDIQQEDLNESFLKILDDKFYHSTNLDTIKHDERWKAVSAILLARLKIYVIEDIKTLLHEKQTFFRLNRIETAFKNNPRIAYVLGLYFMGSSESLMEKNLRKQEKHLAQITDFMKKENGLICECQHSIFVCAQRIDKFLRPFYPVFTLASNYVARLILPIPEWLIFLNVLITLFLSYWPRFAKFNESCFVFVFLSCEAQDRVHRDVCEKKGGSCSFKTHFDVMKTQFVSFIQQNSKSKLNVESKKNK